MDPFNFDWPVDQAGYTIEHVTVQPGQPLAKLMGMPFGPTEFDNVVPRGGPVRYYRPLEDDALWMRFAESCRSPDQVVGFANQYGTLTKKNDQRGVLMPSETLLEEFLNTARRLWEISECLPDDRTKAIILFQQDDGLFLQGQPLMRVTLLPSEKLSGGFEYKLVPQSLRDALLHQAAEAIAGNRRFQRCRNERCPNWFRLGPHAKNEGGKTFTARREFCSDSCRVAHARHRKREGRVNA